jgi:hypothetical protein
MVKQLEKPQKDSESANKIVQSKLSYLEIKLGTKVDKSELATIAEFEKRIEEFQLLLN